jgi:hypothetical protein
VFEQLFHIVLGKESETHRKECCEPDHAACSKDSIEVAIEALQDVKAAVARSKQVEDVVKKLRDEAASKE